MGKKSSEACTFTLDELKNYLHTNHSVYMDVDGTSYYLTDANFQAWRAQDTSQINEKGHYVDCSDLVPTVDEFMVVELKDHKTIQDMIGEAVFYASCPKTSEGEKTPE